MGRWVGLLIASGGMIRGKTSGLNWVVVRVVCVTLHRHEFSYEVYANLLTLSQPPHLPSLDNLRAHTKPWKDPPLTWYLMSRTCWCESLVQPRYKVAIESTSWDDDDHDVTRTRNAMPKQSVCAIRSAVLKENDCLAERNRHHKGSGKVAFDARLSEK